MIRKMARAQEVLRDALKRIGALGYSARIFTREFDFDAYREGVELNADHVDAEYGERFNVVLVPKKDVVTVIQKKATKNGRQVRALRD